MESGKQTISASRPWDGSPVTGTDNPHNALATAIVYQAVKDYVKTLRKMWNKADRDKKRKLILDKMEIEEFFHSEWFTALCDYVPDKVIWNCRQRAREQEEEAIRKRNKKLAKEAVKKIHATEQNEEETVT